LRIRTANPNDLKPHPLAYLIPDMRGSEWEDFYTDVALRGIKVPLEVLADGTVVDGRHRLRAALELGMKEVPIIDAPLNGDNPEVYMLKAAVLRRHLTDDQRAAMAALWKKENPAPRGQASPIYGKSAEYPADSDGDHPARAQATVGFKVTRWDIDRATYLLNHDPEKFEKVHRGETKLSAAYNDVHRREETANIPPFPNGKFQVIYADPPWPYANSGLGGSAESHYPTMSLDEMAKLDIVSLTGDNGVLFLWVTSPFLPEGLRLCQAWGFCVDPRTRILTADLQWKAAGDLKVSEPLVGFDEGLRSRSGCGNGRRYFKWSQVLSTGIEPMESYEVVMKDGTTLRCSSHHKWLAECGGVYHWGFRWVETCDLPALINDPRRQHPIVLPRIMPVFTPLHNYEAGLLSAAFDGEGSIGLTKRGNGLRASFGQKPNGFLEQVASSLRSLGYDFSRYRYLYQSTEQICLKRRRRQTFQFLMQMRPPRLLDRWQSLDISGLSLYNLEKVPILSVTPIGIQEMVTLTTSSGTYIAEGFGAHNTYKTSFVWIKDRSTYGKLGFYNYSQHEFLFVATKGSCLPRSGSLVPSVIVAPKGEHSAKPELVYEIVERMYPGPYIELFARKRRPNWESWGTL